ncbi:neuronal acetylcholine receptor subunit alpha-7-like [Ostrea edulis]|uniref:neuronal acetylcholine receptor subunit alpha-7-like n=1 Tax=Ostrea edulis TaxID=37623 RepID=UPI0024AEF4CF|nr:neuronal acetylcholine receptor subunit alpha-7-like [Ostrea edulis]
MSLCMSLIHLLFLLPFSNGQNIGDVDTETALQNMLFKGYNRYRKPVLNITTNVPFGMVISLYSIEKVDEKSQTFSSVIWLMYSWTDEYLRWNISEYGTEYLRVPAEMIWVPSICGINELAEKMCMTYESVKENEAFIHYTGFVSLYKSVKSTIQCKINLQKYPFDEQRCTFEFMSLISAMHQLEINDNFTLADTSRAVYNGEWSLVSAEKNIRTLPTTADQSPNYFLEFTIKIRRRPTMAIFTVMFPIITLSTMNIFCFVLPIAAGEKIGMSVAIFLTFAVYATLLSENMPTSAENLSWFSIYVTTQVILSAITVVLQSILLRVYHQDPQTDQYEREVDAFQHRLETVMEGVEKRSPFVGSEQPTTIKTRTCSNRDIALRVENVFLVCTISINIVSICLLFANTL